MQKLCCAKPVFVFFSWSRKFSIHILCAEVLHVMEMQRSFITKLSNLKNRLISKINPKSKVDLNVLFYIIYFYSFIYRFIYLYI